MIPSPVSRPVVDRAHRNKPQATSLGRVGFQVAVFYSRAVTAEPELHITLLGRGRIFAMISQLLTPIFSSFAYNYMRYFLFVSGCMHVSFPWPGHLLLL
jgi:hypothetical protein